MTRTTPHVLAAGLVAALLVSLVGCGETEAEKKKRDSRQIDLEVRSRKGNEDKKKKEDEDKKTKSAPQREDKKQNTESYSRIVENAFLRTDKHPLSTFSVDVDTASYSNVRRFLLEEKRLPPP